MPGDILRRLHALFDLSEAEGDIRASIGRDQILITIGKGVRPLALSAIPRPKEVERLVDLFDLLANRARRRTLIEAADDGPTPPWSIRAALTTVRLGIDRGISWRPFLAGMKGRRGWHPTDIKDGRTRTNSYLAPLRLRAGLYGDRLRIDFEMNGGHRYEDKGPGRLHLTGVQLPETLLVGVRGRSLDTLVDHAAFHDQSIVITGATSASNSTVLVLRCDLVTLEAVPRSVREHAIALMPSGATIDPLAPWRTHRSFVCDVTKDLLSL